jgi:DNA-binding CsgD family transcriptional regulator
LSGRSLTTPASPGPAHVAAGDLGAVRIRLGSEQIVAIGFPPPRLGIGSSVTTAERAVVEDLLLGLSNAQIARRRRRSERTVANQVAAVLRKMGAGSRGELLAALSGPAAEGAPLAPPNAASATPATAGPPAPQ